VVTNRASMGRVPWIELSNLRRGSFFFFSPLSMPKPPHPRDLVKEALAMKTRANTTFPPWCLAGRIAVRPGRP